MPRRTASLFLLALLALLPAASEADCRWESVCDAGGDCVQVPICHSAWDTTPPPRAPGIEPVAAPRIEPVEPPPIPSVATRCESVRRCTAHACDWETVCD